MLLRSLSDHTFDKAELRPCDDLRWGRENCIMVRRTRRAELSACMHTLSIRAAWGGTEQCHVGNRDIGVDDDSFLILNHGRVYSSSIRATHPVESLAICFRPGLVERACGAMAVSLDRALSDGSSIAAIEPEFIENLQPHDSCVTPVLHFIRRHALLGLDDEAWYEEQLHFLLERMQRHRMRLLDWVECAAPHARRDASRSVSAHRARRRLHADALREADRSRRDRQGRVSFQVPLSALVHAGAWRNAVLVPAAQARSCGPALAAHDGVHRR